jgi:hypothetical protein
VAIQQYQVAKDWIASPSLAKTKEEKDAQQRFSYPKKEDLTNEKMQVKKCRGVTLIKMQWCIVENLL